MNAVRFLNDAEDEMNAAADWYEEETPGLGVRFLETVEGAVEAIAATPERYPRVHGEVRRCRLRKFPYGVLCRIEPNGVVVIAVYHLHRDPDYWTDRL